MNEKAHQKKWIVIYIANRKVNSNDMSHIYSTGMATSTS